MNLWVKSSRARGLVRLQGLAINNNVSGSLEMSAPREHLIKDSSNAVDISALIDILAGFGLLGRHVLECANNMAGQ